MNLDDKFDRIIRQKVNEAEFPFDEENWQKASRMIDAERGVSAGIKSSKLFLLIGTLFLGVAAGTFAFLYLNGNEQTGSEKNLALITGAGDHQMNQTDAVSAITSDAERTSAMGNPSANGNENTSANDSRIATAADDKPMTDAVAGEDPAYAKGKHAYPSSNSVDAEKASKSSPVQRRENAKTLRSGQMAGRTKKGKAEENTVDIQLLNAANAVSKEEKITADRLEMHSSILQIWKKDEVLRNSPHDFIRIYEDDYYKPKRRKLYLNAEAGGAYLLGWRSGKVNDAEGFNYYGGLNLGFYTGKKMSLSAGVQYYSVAHITQPFYTATVNEYDFGYNGNVTNVTANTVAYVGVPLNVYRNISRTGKLGLGINTALAVNGKNTVETYTERDLVKTNRNVVSEKGLYEGVNPVNMMLSLSYAQRLNRRFFVSAEFVYGISDTFRSDVTKNSNRENNYGLRLGLQYTLFEK